MNIQEQAREIIDTIKSIYNKVEDVSPDNLFNMNIHEDNEYEKIGYHVKTDQISGVIIKENTQDPVYSIQATIRYLNKKGEPRVFAKIRLFEQSGIIQIRGNKIGNCFSNNSKDIDFLENPFEEISFVLDSIQESIACIHEELFKNSKQAIKKYEPKWVKAWKTIQT